MLKAYSLKLSSSQAGLELSHHGVDLLVGQFNDGKIQVYRNLGDGQFADGTWLQAGGGVATVPGVW